MDRTIVWCTGNTWIKIEIVQLFFFFFFFFGNCSVVNPNFVNRIDLCIFL